MLLRVLTLFSFAVLISQGANPTQLENEKPGTTDWQLTNPATAREIEGYASATSVNRGGTIEIFVNTAEPSYRLEVFRMGWYGGTGGRRMTAAVQLPGIRQTIPTPEPGTGLIECRWRDPYVLRIPNNAADPTDWASGFYVAKLTATQSGRQSYVIFVVRDDTRTSDLLFQASFTTYQAYNNWGGKSLYERSSVGGRAYKVSFNRPYAVDTTPPAAAMGAGAGQFFVKWQGISPSAASWEYNMVRWLEREGYDVAYATNIDTHANASLLRSHKAFLSVGHDEYWTWQMRANVEAARDGGVHLGFFSANTCYWQVRLEPGSTGAANRTMTAYKESALDLDPFARDTDTSNDRFITTLWRNRPVSRPEEMLIGVMYDFDPVQGDVVVENTTHWIYAGTNLRNGDHLPGLLGYEVDRMFGNSPAGTVRLANSPYNANGETRYSHMTLYTAPSGALVFATGTMQWAWGLDNWGSPALRRAYENPAAQQITRNVLTRFGAQVPAAIPAPLISAVVNAASYQGSRISPGEIVTLFGSNIGPAAGAALTLDASGRVPTSLADVRVLFDGVPAPLIFARGDQVSAVVPFEVAGSTSARIHLEYQGQRSNDFVVPVGASHPGVFASDASGRGLVAALNQDTTIHRPAVPAARGSVVMLYATGGGLTSPGLATGQVTPTSEPLPQLILPVAVTIGGRPAEVLYAGGAPGYVSGAIQINARVPEDAPTGDVPVV